MKTRSSLISTFQVEEPHTGNDFFMLFKAMFLSNVQYLTTSHKIVALVLSCLVLSCT